MRKSKSSNKVVRVKKVETKPVLNIQEPLQGVMEDKNTDVIFGMGVRTNTSVKAEEKVSIERATLTVAEMAKYLGIGRNKAYEIVKYGSIPSLKIGKQIRIVKAALDIWLMEQGLNTSVS